MVAADMDGSKMCMFGPKFGVLVWLQPVTMPVTVQVNPAEPAALVVSVAVTTVLKVPVVVAVPEINPEEALIDRPGGRPVAV